MSSILKDTVADSPEPPKSFSWKETGAALLGGALESIPGGEAAFALNKEGLAGLGPSTQVTAQEQERLKKEHPTANLVGNVLGTGAQMALGAALFPAALAAGVPAATVAGAGALAASAAIAARHAGEEWHQAQLEATPLNIERMFQRYGLLDLLGAGLGAAGAGIKPAGKLARTVIEDIKNHPEEAAMAAKIVGTGAGLFSGGLSGGILGGLAGSAATPGKVTRVLSQIEKGANKVIDTIDGQVDKLIGGAIPLSSVPGRKNLKKEYEFKSNIVKDAAVDPEGFAARVKARTADLPQPVSDALTSKALMCAQRLAQDLPQTQVGVTVFQQSREPSDTDKRRWLAQYDAIENPFAALVSGEPKAIQVAEEYHPETINKIRAAIMDRVAEKGNLSYSQKLRIGRILGGAGVPSQDPAISARLQTYWRADDETQAESGHKDSARQKKAQMNLDKAAKGWATRAQAIMDEDK